MVLFISFAGWLAYKMLGVKKVKSLPASFEGSYRGILSGKVNFYKQLTIAEQAIFEKRMLYFLSQVTITGINTTVEDDDRVFVGASAIIPIFGFPDWEYNNLNEVLLYPDSFNKDFLKAAGEEKTILGMVGEGAMQHVMVLSQPSLRQGFTNQTDKANTGIHEFVHLVDKTDGAIDGIPENLANKQHLLPWIKRMHENIREIVANRSDINPYGATNEAEFFAVVSEYFFEQPQLLQSKHPELYDLLQTIFRQHPAGKKIIPLMEEH
ncbi:MAG: M90 family metallopeptidase [Ferruginibacter sp.]